MVKIQNEQILSKQEYIIHFRKEDYLFAEMLMNNLEENMNNKNFKAVIRWSCCFSALLSFRYSI